MSGTLPNAARLLSVYPHMHYRGKSFECDVTRPGKPVEALLRVGHYDFHWQLNYRFAQPLPLAAGTRLTALASFDNSANNPLNPDPDAEVTYGRQSTDEMMVAFFDVAVPVGTSKNAFFVRGR